MTVNRIGMVTHGRFPNDARIENEASSLIKAGYSVYIYANREVTKRPVDSFKGAKVRYFSLQYSPIFLLFTLPRLLRQRFRDDKISIVHAQDTPLVLPTIIAATSLQIPVIYDIHEIWHRMVTDDVLTPIIERALLMLWCRISEYIGSKVADAIIVTSEEMAAYITETYSIPPEKIEVVKNVCELPDKNKIPRIELPKNIFKLCYVGNLNSGHLMLDKLIVSAVYLQNLLNFRFYIIGDGKLRSELEALAKKLSVENFIEFTGLISREKAYSYISACDVCLVPYRRNFNVDIGTPHKLFEYSAFGKAIISTPVLSYVRMFRDALYYWEPATAKRLAEIIYDLSQNDALRQKLGRACKTLVEKKYNWHVEERKLIEVYQRIVHFKNR